MPHVIVKLWPGRSEEQKVNLANKIVDALKETIDAKEGSISVAIEEVESEKWMEEVYKPDIFNKPDKLYIRPGM